jgi:two-component system NarL family sensor kinase
LGEALVPEAALTAIVKTVKESFKLPFAAIHLARVSTAAEADEEVIVAAGQYKGDCVRMQISYHGEPVGYLVLAHRWAAEPFRPQDEKLLEQLIIQAGPVVNAYSLTVELLRSRQSLVMARETERRRIRRDLHDGLGPVLAAKPSKSVPSVI